MAKRIIKIDEEKCTGCGACIDVCYEGVIGIVGGKAKLLSADYCDGLGNCLHGCPVKAISFEGEGLPETSQAAPANLNHWPLKIKLVSPSAPFLDGADLLVSADCASFANPDFHNDWMKDRVTLIGCPKLDDGDYSKKLSAILKQNDIKSVTAVRMEVPCCGGIENSVKAALGNCGKLISSRVVTISTDGEVESVV